MNVVECFDWCFLFLMRLDFVCVEWLIVCNDYVILCVFYFNKNILFWMVVIKISDKIGEINKNFKGFLMFGRY